MLSSHLLILFNPHLHGEPKYAFGRTVLQALLSMSPGFGTLGWGCHLADVPGQLDHPCCASFGLAICHTGSVCFGLAQLYVTVTSAYMSINVYQASLRGVALVIITNLFPLLHLYCYSCRGSFTCMFVDQSDRMILN